MRTLSATLLAAQKAASGLPYVRVEVLDRASGVARPALSRLYTGPEPHYYHDALLLGDGALLRARVDPGGGLYVQRVPNPGPGSNFGSWTYLTQASPTGISLAAQGAQVRLFFSTDSLAIYQCISYDYGATWGSPQIVVNPAVDVVKWVAAAFTGTGPVALFFAADPPAIYVMKESGGPWSNPVAWPHASSGTYGVACFYDGDWQLLVAGRATSGEYALWTCTYGNGASQAADTWSSLRSVMASASDSQVTFGAPFLHRPDVYRLFCVESYAGTVAYNRPVWSHIQPTESISDNRWREPVPFDTATAYGVAVAGNSQTLWLSTPSGVWRGNLAALAQELTADLLELDAQELAMAAGEARLVLRNDDGRYNDLGSGVLRQGSELRTGPGYRTTAGDEASTGPSFLVEGWEHTSGGGQARVIVHARSPWSLLERWRARRQYAWSAGAATVLDILRSLLARSGLPLSATSPSSAISSLRPEFTVHPEESGARAVARLLGMVPDVLVFQGLTATLANPQESEAAGYSFGGNHAILAGRYGGRALTHNRVQAYGAGLMAEQFDWPSVSQVHDRLLQVHDLNLTTVQQVQDRAEATLRQTLLSTPSGELLVPPNCGQELYDVVSVTDPGAGLSAATYRVVGIRWEFRRQGRPRYLQRLSLSAP